MILKLVKHDEFEKVQKELAAKSPDPSPNRYVKGVSISKFDLSFGPTPITRYPADFISDEQSNRLAVQSMIQLNTSKGKRVSIMLTVDEIEAIGIGMLGSLSGIGFYSVIIFFSQKAPRSVSESVGKIFNLLTTFNANLVDSGIVDESSARDLYSKTCRLLSEGREEDHVDLTSGLPELGDIVAKIGGAMRSLIPSDLRAIALEDMRLVDSLADLIGCLNRASVEASSSGFSKGLDDVLFEIDKVRRSVVHQPEGGENLE
jgi:hypothetical protein